MTSSSLISLIILTFYLSRAAVAFCPPFIGNEEGCTCFSYVDGAVITCDGPKGPAVIEKLKTTQTEIRELNLNNANIIEIGPYAFRNLRIKNLNLDNNRIKSIHPDAFRGLEYTLQKLSIEHNKLVEIPSDALIGMINLKVLSVKCNTITDLREAILRNASQLIELNLACNQICNVAAPVFFALKSSLQSLIMDNNCMRAMPAESLRGFTSLMALHMQYNQIESLDQLQLMDLPNLIMLRLTGNRIRSIDQYAVNNVPNLRYLYLDRNQLNSVVPQALQQFRRLEIADLSYNNIAEIPSQAFAGMQALMQLNLQGNSITDIAPGAFKATPLLVLMLAQNCLSAVNPQMFQGVPFLRHLSLAHNNIRLVQPLSFAHLANLHLLDMTHNKVQVLQPGALTASGHVTVLLQENPVVCAQDGYHIVQGSKPIHLLNEPNMVCKTDYTSDTTDTCPTRKEPAPPQPCCIPKARVVAPTDPSGGIPVNVQTRPPPVRQPTARPQVPRFTATPSPKRDGGAKIETPAPAGATTKKGINLERFWRLTKRPGSQSFSDIRVVQPGDNQNPVTPTAPVAQFRPIGNPNQNVIPAVTPGNFVDPLAARGGPFLPNSGLTFDRLQQGDQLPPWVVTSGANKPSGIEFSSDAGATSIQKSDSSQVRLN